MRHWLLKSEPDAYSFSQLQADGRTAWTGVRNAQARNSLREMKAGDRALYYHSGDGKEVVGIAAIVTEAYPDPTAPDDPRWVVVDVVPVEPLARPVSLARFKADPVLCEAALVKQGRLSVTPLTPEQYARVLELASA